MKLVDFLKKKIGDSIESLIKLVVKKLERATSLDGVLGTMISVATTTMRTMGMVEEIKFLHLLVSVKMAEKGIDVGEFLKKLTPPGTTVSVVSAYPPVTQPAKITVPQKISLVQQAASPSTIAPARTLSSTEGLLKGFRGLIKGILGESKHKPFNQLRPTIKRIVEERVSLAPQDWSDLFSAMNVAEERSNHLIDGDYALEFFMMAPLQLVRNWVFGHEGLGGVIVSTSAVIADDKTPGEIPTWMAVKSSVVLTAIKAMEDRGIQFSEAEESCLGRFCDLLDDREIPDFLRHKVDYFTEVTPEEVHEEANRATSGIMADAFNRAKVASK